MTALRRGALLAALCWLLATPAVASTRLAVAFETAMNSDKVAPAALVRVIVETLSEDYLDAARAAAGDSEWAQQTRAYVSGLWRAVDAVEAGYPVRWFSDPDRSLRLVVQAPAPVMIAVHAAYPARQQALEDSIVSRLCIVAACAQASAIARSATPPTTRPLGHDGSGAPAVHDEQQSGAAPAPRQLVANLSAASAGLRCAAAQAPHQRLHLRACKRALAAVRALLETLHVHLRAGNEVDWALLGASHLSPDGHRLQVAPALTIVLPDPLLARGPEMIRQAAPWLEAVLYGETATLAVSVPPRLVYAAWQ